MKRFGFPLDPEVVRKLLTDTGLPQQGTGGNIGPLVNLRNAINKLLDGNITAKPTVAPSKAKPTGTKAAKQAKQTANLKATPSTAMPTATPTNSTNADKSQLF